MSVMVSGLNHATFQAYLSVDDYALSHFKAEVIDLLMSYGKLTHATFTVRSLGSLMNLAVRVETEMYDDALRPLYQEFEQLWRKFSKGKNDGSHWKFTAVEDRMT